jgi:hypothetical protein
MQGRPNKVFFIKQVSYKSSAAAVHMPCVAFGVMSANAYKDITLAPIVLRVKEQDLLDVTLTHVRSGDYVILCAVGGDAEGDGDEGTRFGSFDFLKRKSQLRRSTGRT